MFDKIILQNQGDQKFRPKSVPICGEDLFFVFTWIWRQNSALKYHQFAKKAFFLVFT